MTNALGAVIAEPYPVTIDNRCHFLPVAETFPYSFKLGSITFTDSAAVVDRVSRRAFNSGDVE